MAADHTAVNWDGDLATLGLREVLDRMSALAGYAAARLRPFSEWDASPCDASEANRALDMWDECRRALGRIQERGAFGQMHGRSDA